jgi:hypothetical protein
VLAATQRSCSLSRLTAQARFGGRFFQSVGEGDDMADEQFTAFSILLAAVSVPSVSLLFAGAWELWRYAKRAGQ